MIVLVTYYVGYFIHSPPLESDQLSIGIYHYNKSFIPGSDRIIRFTDNTAAICDLYNEYVVLTNPYDYLFVGVDVQNATVNLPSHFFTVINVVSAVVTIGLLYGWWHYPRKPEIIHNRLAIFALSIICLYMFILTLVGQMSDPDVSYEIKGRSNNWDEKSTSWKYPIEFASPLAMAYIIHGRESFGPNITFYHFDSCNYTYSQSVFYASLVPGIAYVLLLIAQLSPGCRDPVEEYEELA